MNLDEDKGIWGKSDYRCKKNDKLRKIWTTITGKDVKNTDKHL